MIPLQMLPEAPIQSEVAQSAPSETNWDTTSSLKNIAFPLSHFNPWEAALLTDKAIQTHLLLLQQLTGAPIRTLFSQNEDPKEISPSDWTQKAIAQAWALAQRISPEAHNAHLAWRSAEQIFRFGMAFNRSTYFLTPYTALFQSWEPFGKETLPIYAREGLYLCQRWHPKETPYHMAAFYVGALLYETVKTPAPADSNSEDTLGSPLPEPNQHPVIAAYLYQLEEWSIENGATELLNKRLQRHRYYQSQPLTSLQIKLWHAAYAAYTQDLEPLVKLTLETATQLSNARLILMGERISEHLLLAN